MLIDCAPGFAGEPTTITAIAYLSFRLRRISFSSECMSISNHSWRDLYRAALLEVDPAQLPRVAEGAMEAIQRKLRESPDGEISAEERQALQDAQQNLRVLQREYS